MNGLMQEKSLLISSLLEHAERYSAKVEVVSRRVEGDVHRYTWTDVAQRSRQLAMALDEMDLPAGSRVASIAWNGYRHLELYYGVSGSQRVLHTINPRLHASQVVWMLEHAEDDVVFFDASFVELVRTLQPLVPSVRHWVLLGDQAAVERISGMPAVVSYESLLARHSGEYTWPQFDELAASSLCYTSGTTGNPKGALYSHRSTVLHSMILSTPGALSIGPQDVVMPVVPMFHVNGWGTPYCSAMVGCKLVLPGPALDGESVYALIEQEGVTLALGVPTVWQMLLDHVDARSGTFTSLKRTTIGGAACSPSMQKHFEDRYGVEVIHAWGMTETSPLGTTSSLMAEHRSLSREAQQQMRLKQGRPLFGVDLRIVDDRGAEQPWNGQSCGHLQVKGHWVISSYFKDECEQRLDDGWFATGDVATLDANAYLQLTDRSKDVVKSGGEWLSTIDIENIAMSHPSVSMAAALGVPHPKWGERPIVLVAKREGAVVSREEVLGLYEGKLARWQTPDDVIFVDTIPLGATGKMLKTELRKLLVNYELPATVERHAS